MTSGVWSSQVEFTAGIGNVKPARQVFTAYPRGLDLERLTRPTFSIATAGVHMSIAPHINRSPDWMSRAASAAVQTLDNCVVVTADGEIDAANADIFAAYALEHVNASKNLVLDLTMLNFFGIESFSALHTLNTQCAAADVQWALAAGEAVSRVLRICDPAGALPAAATLDSAKRLLHSDQAPLLQLVSQPR